jgi:hypothetical protein
MQKQTIEKAIILESVLESVAISFLVAGNCFDSRQQGDFLVDVRF